MRAPLSTLLETMETRIPPALFAVDLTECTLLLELDPTAIPVAFGAALRRAGATIVEQLSHTFPGAGLTCVFILSESHAVLHTWPETGTVNIDIFSCSTRLRSLEAIEELRQTFGALHVAIQEIAHTDGHSRPSHGRR